MKFFYSILLIFIISIFNACGYKPTALYTTKSLSGKVYIKVDTDINNSRYAVLVKDTLITLLIDKLHLQITTNKKEADSFITSNLLNVTHTQLQSDTSGFVKVYRESINIEVQYYKKNEKMKKFVMSNYYDYSVADDSTLTQTRKEEAISTAISKALSDLFSKIAVNEN